VKGKVTGSIRTEPWPSPVEGWVPLKPGEHPRLLFRKSDLPALRKRAKHPEAKLILARLNKLLQGPYTLWHAAGYAFLYQLTGDRKYAQQAKEHVDRALAGTPDRDRRYGFTNPGGKLRAGPSYSAIALAYDMCYQAWDEAYRKRVAQEIQRRLPPLMIETGGGQHNFHSNHYAAWNGGGGIAALGIVGDPGTDDELLARSLRIFKRRIKRTLLCAYGDHGWFTEGPGPSRLSLNMGLTQFLLVSRTAAGKDWVKNRSSAQWLLTRWTMEMMPSGGKPHYLHRGAYGSIFFDRDGTSHGGDFSQGFGILPEEHKPAVLWVYNHFVDPGPDKDYDAVRYPHRAVYAFLHWPIGTTPKNPAEVLPKVMLDRQKGYCVFRSRWKDEDDIVITFLFNSDPVHRSVIGVPNGVMVWGLGLRTKFPGGWHIARTTYFHREDDGSGVVGVTHGGGQGVDRGSFAVDFSGLSGAPALLAMVETAKKRGERAESSEGLTPQEKKELAGILGRMKKKAEKKRKQEEKKPGAPAGRPNTRLSQVVAGGYGFRIMTLQRGPAPEVKVVGGGDDQKVVIGKRTIWFDGEKIVFGRRDRGQ